MPDIGIGWSELLFIAVLAIVVVGPKDLPRLMAQASRWMRAARRMANEFQGHLDQLAREAELADLEKETRVVMTDLPSPPKPPPPISALPPEGGVFNPPEEDLESAKPPAARGTPS